MKMNGGRSDASTSTDDVKSRPLCLFYFTHPFGVLSPEPPTLAAAPAHIARAFVNMEPVSPYSTWGAPSDDSYGTSYNTGTSSSRPEYELGNATVHAAPVDLVSVTRARKCTLDFSARRESLSSSLFSSDMWFNSSSSGKSTEYPRRLIPLNKILPPLHLPSPRDSSNVDSSDDLWPKKCLNPEKFSLPPIELPTVKVKIVRSKKCVRSSLTDESWSGEGRAVREASPRRRRRHFGVSKPRRRHAARPAAADLRRLLAALMRRALPGGGGASPAPALRDALNTIREAWAEPRSLRTRCRAVRCTRVSREAPARAAMDRAHAPTAALARPDASPGLLRRRYSVPETIMRKYRLAQQRSDTEESVPATCRSAASASPTPEAAHHLARRDRELMRKSALLRRMWGRADCRGCCCCGAELAPCGLETRSLDGSRSELLHPSSGPASPRYSHAAGGWATPKRQRLDSRDFRGSDEILRAAMRNSYDRAEESRDRAIREDLSDSTYRSHADHPEMMTDAFTDSEMSKCENRSGSPGRDAFTHFSEQVSCDTATIEMKSIDDTYGTSDPSPKKTFVHLISNEPSFSDSSGTFSASLCTAKETLQAIQPCPVDSTHSSQFYKCIRKQTDDLTDVGHNSLPYNDPLTVGTASSYEVLEIVVSESQDMNPVPAIHAPSQEKPLQSSLRTPAHKQKNGQNINIDEYVSNILVESLNSLTDQLECISASIGSDRKISIVEKEIKVKLQNTGVNTIVHLSPTSNNQIIFGNEELFNEEGKRDACNNALTIREEVHSEESNNNIMSPGVVDSSERCPCDSFDIHHNVNQAVLQQIQKLFQDGLQSANGTSMPEISHIQVSDVDVFIDSAEAALMTEMEESSTNFEPYQYEVISGVGTGNYYPDVDNNPVVPRFSALPHTDSMEVNTSSSEDADLIGSECTSLVDSLDDPNSPRSILLRRANSGRRGELVRSAIDVLDLLPENTYNDNTPREKPESFFIGIKENESDCDKENVNVADSMPEKIKQRLYRRHRKRELRMECARRTRSRQQRGDTERSRAKQGDAHHARRDLERDCIAIVNALIDDVIAKIAQDEYKCMRIKHRPTKVLPAKSENNITRRIWKKEFESMDDREPFKAIKNGCVRSDTKERRTAQKSDQTQIHGKLSLRPTPSGDNRTAKRIYQKSEIHEGNKCIEILEILEYVNGSDSSPENTNSDENQNPCKTKKSRIPVPISERSQRSPNGDSQRNNNRRWVELQRGAERDDSTNRLIADMLLGALAERPAPRAARERANSLRFRQVFDIIPEERSSLSLDSGTEELSYNRRASAPDVVVEYHVEEPSERECDDAAPAPCPLGVEQKCDTGDRLKLKQPVANETPRKTKETKSAATSPMSDINADKRGYRSRHQTTMTSPSCKSAATSPLRGARGWARARGSAEGVDEKSTEPDEPPRRPPPAAPLDTRRPVRPARRPSLARSQSYEHVTTATPNVNNNLAPLPGEHHKPHYLKARHERNSRICSSERSKEETVQPVKLPEFKGGGSAGSSSDSSGSGGSLLCPLAPRWLAPARARRHRAAAPPASPPAPPAPPPDTRDVPGAWSVTVAGSCGAARPADLEMRLRFPPEHAPAPPAPQPRHECACRHCAACPCAAPSLPPPAACACASPPAPASARPDRPPRPPRPPPARLARTDTKLTLTMKKEALDSSILASKNSRKSSAQLPDVETYRASRSRLKSSVKTRRSYSLHCWLPDNEDAPIRARDGLSVLGCAIVPELKPRVPTMSERDLTRQYTPRHYLRS